MNKNFPWYNLVSFVIIAYKARHTLNDEDLISGFVLFEKAYENKQVLENGRDKKHT